MARKGRPAGVKAGLYTVAVSQEIYDQVDELAIGSGMSRTAVANLLITKGLENVQIVEETIKRKRLVFSEGE